LAQSADTTENRLAGVAGDVRLDGIRKQFHGAPRPAVDNVDLMIEPGSFFAILGPSGCGKTTMLRMIAGFEWPDEGRIRIGGRDVTSLSPRQRDIAMVFQDYALYPHMTAEQNIAFNLRNAKVPKAEAKRLVQDAARRLGIDHLLGKKPGQLSGGEQQRVALGRAVVRKPSVFLMDEPLSNLDVKLREAMRIELGQLHQDLGITTVYVTHDQVEALTLSTRLAVMRDGKVQQVGAPHEVYANPANTFVARFIGAPSMNVFAMRRDGPVLRGLHDTEATLPLADGVTVPDGAKVFAGIRPHHVVITDEPGGIGATVSLVEHLGRNNFVVCEPRGGADVLHEGDAIQIETAADVAPEPGTELRLTASPEHVRLFAEDGSAIPGARPTPLAQPLR
jgi:ABC-type sugar transport system ATPase subunit